MKEKSASAPAREDTANGTLSDNEKLNWIRLLRTPNIGPVTFWELLAHFGGAAAALEALPALMAASGRSSIRSIPSLSQAEREIEKAHAAGMRLQAAGEPDYPPMLARVEIPPPLLYVRGAHGFWSRPALAVVGSRNASGAGLKFAGEISAALGAQGFRIVSGLARGIDAAAHRAALGCGTAAVLAGGLDAIYPPEHSALAQQILENGLLIGECPPGFLARAQDFPRRNRIISGCCHGVVVVEASERSGSLITARLAAEQNREVFAVPGHPFEPRAAGTNGLLKDGAILTTSADDVVAALASQLRDWGPLSRHATCPALRSGMHGVETPALPSLLAKPEVGSALFDSDSMRDAKADLLKVLGYSPIDVDDLVRLTGLEARHVSAALLALDLEGRIERHGHGSITLKP